MIRILLVDDQTILLQALEALLEKEQDFQVVGSVDNGQAAIEQVEALQPDVVLLDIQMPGMDGVTATWLICQRFPGTKILVLSGGSSDKQLTNALRAGAKGYLLKDTASKDLANAIRSVYRGHTHFGPGLFEKIICRVPAPDSNSEQSSSQSAAIALPEPGLPLQLKGFDRKALPEVVHRAIEQKMATELSTRLSHYLKRDPANSTALYLVGALAHRSQGNKILAFQYLKFGFKEGMKQGLSREDLLLFYREGALLKPEEAFTWLTQVGGPWDDETGMSFLSQEAVQIFGLDSSPCHVLLTLRRLRVTQTLSDVCTSFSSRLETLDQGFERLNKLLKR